MRVRVVLTLLGVLLAASEDSALAQITAPRQGRAGPARSKGGKGPETFVFLNRTFTSNRWNALQSQLDCMVTRGAWEELPEGEQSMYRHSCSPLYRDTPHCNGDEERPREGLRYRWTAPICRRKYAPHFHLWNRTAMCALLRDKRIFLLGDSMTEEFAITLLASMWNSTDPACAMHCPSPHACEGRHWEAVPCAGKSAHVTTYKYWEVDVSSESGADIVAHLGATNLMVLNRGAHFRNSTEVLRVLNNTLSYMQTHHPYISLIYRSTSPAHPNCSETAFAKPLEDYPRYAGWDPFPRPGEPAWRDPLLKNLAMEPSIERNYDAYHWAEFYQQNQVVRAFLRRHFPRVLYLDVYPSTFLRPDSHMSSEDCLHYCIPGPVDNWVVLFYNALSLVQAMGA